MSQNVATVDEATYRFIAENIPQQVWTSAPSGALDYVNPIIIRYFNQSAEAILGAGWKDVIHPEDLPACVERWTRSLTTGEEYEVEFRLRRHDGVYLWHLGRALPMRDASGTINRWFGTNTDIDDRKRLIREAAATTMLARQVRHTQLRADVSAALSHKEAVSEVLGDCCQAMVDHLGAAFARVWTLNHDTQILELQASAGLYTHLDGGHSRVPVGKFKIGLIAKEREAHLTNDVANDPRVGDHAWAAREGMVSFAGYPLMASDRCVGVVAMFAREPLADDTLSALAWLADAVAQGVERARAEDELAVRAQELARSNEELERFAYVASHDLQEPLRMVASYTQLLGRRYKGKLDATADEFIAFAVDGANRMQALINDLLSFSRVGTKSGAHVPTSLEVPFAQALLNLSSAISESAGEITHDPLPTLAIEPSQIMQVFQNLLGNGLKFHGTQSPRIHVGAALLDGEWAFSVRDHGIGILPEFRDRLFVMFQRLHNRSEYPGNGIGLAICKKIVERHGGRIWVESEPGKSTTFFFTLKGPAIWTMKKP